MREAIDSVLGQEFDDCECLVIDGVSTDGSRDVILSYGSAIRCFIGKDKGQADAIRRGFEELDTPLVGWLNSDGRLLPGALQAVASAYSRNPEGALFHGCGETIEDFGRLLYSFHGKPLSLEGLRNGRAALFQPGSFYRLECVREVGGVDPEWKLLMDLDLWLRLMSKHQSVLIPQRLGQFRIHAAAKSSARPYHFYREAFKVWRIHGGPLWYTLLPMLAARLGVHFMRYCTGSTPNLRTPDKAPMRPPTVRFDSANSERLFNLKVYSSAGTTFSIATAAEPDIEVVRCRAEELAEVRRSRRAGSRLAAVIAIVDSNSKNRHGTRLQGEPAFVLTSEGEGLRKVSWPPFRMGLIDSESARARAINIAAGVNPINS